MSRIVPASERPNCRAGEPDGVHRETGTRSPRRRGLKAGILSSVMGAVLALAVWSAGPAAAAAPKLDTYPLGPQDQIRLKVYEWRASSDEIFEWKALNDVFTIGPDGSVSLPFAGTIRAAGMTADALASTVAARLKQRMGLVVPPDTSIEIVQYRPFFIVGYVTNPGAFPYRPDLTVLQALSIAGGLRVREDNLLRIEREMITGHGDVSVLSLDVLGLLARKARLEAELANADSIAFPKQITDREGNNAVALMIRQEESIMTTRREGLDTQLRALDDLRDFLTKELDTLQSQLGFHDKQIGLIEKELEGISSLVEKGYATAPRQIALESTLAQLQSDRLSAETNLLRARQDISKTEIAALDLRNKYKSEVTLDLRDTQSKLEETRSKADTAVQLLQDSQITAPLLMARNAQATTAQPTYIIIRRTEKGTVSIDAGEDTPVEPGDTLKVEKPPLPDLDLLNPGVAGMATGSLQAPSAALAPAPGGPPASESVSNQ